MFIRLSFLVFGVFSVITSSVSANNTCAAGDLNGDYKVDLADLTVLAEQWVGSHDYIPAGLAGLWRFDDGPVSGTAVDESSHGRNGTLVGMNNNAWVSGRFGGALELDGIDDYVEITGYMGVTGINPRTCGAWVKTTTSGVIMNWGVDVLGGRWTTVVNPAGRLRQEVGGGAIVGSTVIADGNWHHVAVVSDGTDIANIVLYVDGKRETRDGIASRTIDTQSTENVMIGTFPRGLFFAGLIDDVFICNRALSPLEIAIVSGTASDLDGDGWSDMDDFAVLAGEWRANCSGYMRVSITPAQAVAEGAQWRFEGGQWHDADEPVGVLAGNHIIEFKPVNGWAAPTAIGKTVEYDKFAEVEAVYSRLADSGPVISEFMAVNSYVPFISTQNMYTKVSGQTVYPDWIEIHNVGASTVDLAGWYLTDDSEDLTKWRFPANRNLTPGAYMVVYASTKTEEVYPNNYPFVDDLGNLHTSFAIAGSGGYLALVNPDGETIAHEYKDYPEQRGLVSYGLAAEGYGYLLNPTREGPNTGRYLGVVGDTKFSRDRGYYDAPFEVAIRTATPGATIRYTINGTEPTATYGGEYSAPVSITTTKCLRAAAFKDGWLPTNADTQTYIFLEDVIHQPALPAGFPTTWGNPYDYEMDPDVVGNVLYRDTIKEDLKSVPVMSIVTDVDYIFGSSGIYANPNGSGIGWERPCSVEFFDADGGKEFQVNCGVRIYGGVGRNTNFEKHTFRFLFKGGYGPSKLNFPLFGKGAVESFDTIILRAGFNNAWHRHNSSEELRAQYLRDEWIRQSQLDMDRPGLHGTFVHLYVNGLYWGLYNPVERANADFGSSYFGGEKEEWDAINSYPRNVVDGTGDAWVTAQSIADAGVADTAGYAELAQYVDIPNLIDYMLLNYYAGNIDWDDHNWYAVRKRVEGAGYMFLGWDSERVLESITGTNKTSMDRANKPSRLHSRLKLNPEYRLQFADHTHRHLFNEGTLTPKKTRARYKKWSDFIDRAIVGESARWGDSSRSAPYTRNAEWVYERDRLLNQYFPQRTLVAMGFLRGANLYPDTDAPIFHINGIYQHGGHADVGDTLTMTDPTPTGSAKIYYTLDGTDPRIPAVVQPGTTMTLVAESAPKKVLVPTGDIGTDWRGGNEPYNVSGWVSGTGGVGYERNSGYESYFNINVIDMYNNNNSCYIRITFNIDFAELQGYNYMKLRVRYDDGFVAYLNGNNKIHSANFSGDPQWNSGASGNHGDSLAKVFVDFDVSEHIGLLQDGSNILAIHGLNYSGNQSDFLISAELLLEENAPSNGGEVSRDVIEYDNADPPILSGSVTVKARILDSEWSALNEAIYSVGPVRDDLRVTEIMYHPSDPPASSIYNDEDFEFVELKNIGTEPLDLAMVRFTNGIDFSFGSLVLGAGNYIVVAKDRVAFALRYPDFNGPVAGPYNGNLENDGEKIELVDAAGLTIQEFEYSDGWYEITDGRGFSLNIKDPTLRSVDHVDGGLQLHLKLDEHAGGTAIDSSGYGRHGVVNGYPVWRPCDGLIKGALSFDGVADSLTITGYKGILGSSPRTCTAWIKTTTPGVTIMNWGLNVLGGRWTTVVDSAGRLRHEVGGGAIVGSTSVTDGKWHHIAVASDGIDLANIVLYVDGTRQTPDSVASRTIDTQSADDATIGASTGTVMGMRGLIDNVCVYDRVLGDAEIALLAESDDYWGRKRYWRPSAEIGGSPGADDPDIIPELGSIVINEVLAHSHALDPDWIELHNTTTDQAINIGGWFLSDSGNDLKKYEILTDTIINPGGYAVFYENLHFGQFAPDPGRHTPFAISENGETIYLTSGKDGVLTGYTDEEDFGASETNVSFGRYQKSTGTFNFVAMSEKTPNAGNTYPKVGPIVISEIMYHPAVGGALDKEEYEYIELYNTTNSPAPLYEYDADAGSDIPWKFTDGIEYTFPLGTDIPPYSYLLVVKNPAAFAERHGSPAGVDVLGPYDKKLNNDGEKLEISMPGDTDVEGRYYIRIDRVVYNDAGGWPTTPDGTGMSLTRINKTAYGNDVINWHAADPTPGE